VESLIEGLARYGSAVLFVICFLEAIGAPIPASIALITAGALMANGKIPAAEGIGAAACAFVTADTGMFFLGRHTGWGLLSFLCRVSTNPESCILNSARSFYKRGRTAILVAKFLPGLGAMAAPMAGSMHMRLREFLLFDLAGSALYAGTYLGLGFVFKDVLSAMIAALEHIGRLAEAVLAIGCAAFVLYHGWIIWKNRKYGAIPMVDASQVDGRVLDVRSHGYYDPNAQRIQGSARLEPNRLHDFVAGLPRDEMIFLYCT
jgi:membrane protein DedA with SNARE-associated domain